MNRNRPRKRRQVISVHVTPDMRDVLRFLKKHDLKYRRRGGQARALREGLLGQFGPHMTSAMEPALQARLTGREPGKV